MKKYITKSHKSIMRERKEFTIFGTINVFVKDSLPQEINLTNTIMELEDTIPQHLFHDIDMIIIGQFNELNSRGIRAAYMDGAVYATNEQPSEEQLFEDIIHEIAHAVEKSYEYDIYGDDSVEKEYLGKKKRFLDLLQANGIRVPNRIRYETEYSKLFDEFLFYEIGYDKVAPFSQGLFLSPYASVSVSEYFATAFERYFVQSDAYVKEICPQLFNKLKEISEIGD
tara:strand:+ start:7584 stop:8261 length:678 start_codon:yes stop_codon:yes gene_type:complete